MNTLAPSLLGALASACLAAEPVQDEDFTPGLVEAIEARSPARVWQLLDAGVPAGSVSSDGDTPLCTALRLGLTDIAAELLRHGADASACGSDGQPPIALASLRRGPVLMNMLLDAGANPNCTLSSPVTPPVLNCIADDNLRNFLKRERKVTPLMACVVRGDVEAVSLLLQNRAGREARTSPNRLTALDLAAQHGYVYMMRLLLGRDPEKEPQVLVRVILSRQLATLQVEGETRFQTVISTGRTGYATPEGLYVVTHKYKQWTSTLYKVPMPFFMRLNSGNFGLHSGYVTGAPASHGCIRLPDAMARKFFDIITPGDEVIIER